MSFLYTYSKELISGAITVCLWVATRVLQPKVNLQYGFPHGFTFLIDQQYVDPATNQQSPRTLVHSRTYLVRNEGNRPATDVQLVFNYKPQHKNLWPVRHFMEDVDQQDRYIMTFDNLAPKEYVSIEALAVQPFTLPELLSVRSEQAVGRRIAVVMYEQFPAWKRRLARLLALIGIGASIYLLMVFIQWLVLKTPGGLAALPLPKS